MCSYGCSQSHSDSLSEWMEGKRTQARLPSRPTTLQPADEIGLLFSASLISSPVIAQCSFELGQPSMLQLEKCRPERGKDFCNSRPESEIEARFPFS